MDCVVNSKVVGRATAADGAERLSIQAGLGWAITVQSVVVLGRGAGTAGARDAIAGQAMDAWVNSEHFSRCFGSSSFSRLRRYMSHCLWQWDFNPRILATQICICGSSRRDFFPVPSRLILAIRSIF